MKKRYHLIGIGGVGMSGIAQLLLSAKEEVSGSDIKESRVTGELRGLGARIFIGHDSGNVRGADEVIYSSAIREDNPEIIEARRQGISLVKRAQALAGLMRDKTVITIAGSHGKTTTTSLAAFLLLEAGLQPSVAIGGILKNINTNAQTGAGKFFVAEADESDGSFLYYRPKYSVITNIDREHLDYYKEFRKELAAFKEFLSRTEEGGAVFCCGDDINLKKILADYKNRYLLFGLTDKSDIYPKNIRMIGLASEFDCYYKGSFMDRFQLALAGYHNISNALAVIALGLELGIDLRFIKETLSNYKGARRRLEVKFSSGGVSVIDDYAHHPTEITATLAALKNFKQKRLIAVFQPHRYTRTKLLLDEFGASFGDADYIVITDIYAASEPVIEGIDATLIRDKIKKYCPKKEVIFLPREEILEHIFKINGSGDLIVTLGAGDIAKVSDELVERFKRQG